MVPERACGNEIAAHHGVDRHDPGDDGRCATAKRGLGPSGEVGDEVQARRGAEADRGERFAAQVGVPQIVEATIEAKGLAEMCGGRGHAEPDQDQGNDGNETIADARHERRRERADGGLHGQRECDQGVLARREPRPVPPRLDAVLGIDNRTERSVLPSWLGLPVLDWRGVRPRHLKGCCLQVLETDVGLGDVGVGEARNPGVGGFTPFRYGLDHAEVERIADARGDAGRLQTDLQPIDAHVAFLDLASHGVELRRVVGAHPCAVAAAETDVRILDHGPVLRMLGIGARRATLEADRVVAVVARHRDIDARVVGVGAALDVADRAKAQMWRQVVLLAAGGFAGMAADAVVRGEVERVLVRAVRVVADPRIAVDDEARPVVTVRQQLDRVAVAIERLGGPLRELCVIRLVVAQRDH